MNNNTIYMFFIILLMVSITIIEAQTQNCLDFDGVDDYVELPNESDFDFTTAIVISLFSTLSTLKKKGCRL